MKMSGRQVPVLPCLAGKSHVSQLLNENVRSAVPVLPCLAGKFHVSQLLNEYGVNPASIESGSPNLTLTSPFVRPDDKQVGGSVPFV